MTFLFRLSQLIFIGLAFIGLNSCASSEEQEEVEEGVALDQSDADEPTPAEATEGASNYDESHDPMALGNSVSEVIANIDDEPPLEEHNSDSDQGTNVVNISEANIPSDMTKDPKKKLHYKGILSVNSTKPKADGDAMMALIKGFGGRIENYELLKIFASVPSERFIECIARIEERFKVLSKNLQLMDLTRRFYAINARITVLKDLIKTYEKLQKERKLTVDQIKKLAKLRSTLTELESSLRKVVRKTQFSTLTINLRQTQADPLLVSNGIVRNYLSWVAKLGNTDTSPDDQSFELNQPRGFIVSERSLFETKYRNAKNATVSATIKKNQPQGASEFWQEVTHKIWQNQSAKVENASAGLFKTVKIVLDEYAETAIVLVGFYARGDKVYLVESYFPSSDIFKEDSPAVVSAMSSWKI